MLASDLCNRHEHSLNPSSTVTSDIIIDYHLVTYLLVASPTILGCVESAEPSNRDFTFLAVNKVYFK
jgi:hypothetical protein